MHHRLQLIGNLGKDPEIHITHNGSPVCNFPVATNHRWTDNNDCKQESVTWFRVTVWGRQAESCYEYLKKGDLVFIEGSLYSDEYGNPKSLQFEVKAGLVIFLKINR